MNYSLEISRRAARYLQRLDPDGQARIAETMRKVAADPFGAASKPMVGFPGDRSARVGSFRILMTVYRDRRVVRVHSIGSRGQIYRELGR